jgi:hypothetical protein
MKRRARPWSKPRYNLSSRVVIMPPGAVHAELMSGIEDILTEDDMMLERGEIVRFFYF